MKKIIQNLILYDNLFKEELQKAIIIARKNGEKENFEFAPKVFNKTRKSIEQILFIPRSPVCTDHDALAPVNLEFRVYYDEEHVGRYNIKSQTQRTFCFDWECVHKNLDLIASINPILKNLILENENSLKIRFNSFVKRSSCSSYIKRQTNTVRIKENNKYTILDISFSTPSSRCCMCKKSNIYWRILGDKKNDYSQNYSNAVCGPNCHNQYTNKRIAKTLAGTPDE